MANLKIRIHKGGSDKPKTTISIPGGVLKVASKLIPKQTAKFLDDKGIDIVEIVRLSENPEVRGTIVEIEEHHKNEKIVIALE